MRTDDCMAIPGAQRTIGADQSNLHSLILNLLFVRKKFVMSLAAKSA